MSTLTAPAKEKTPPLPPDEKFWKRYSPHHEFSFSSVVSLGAHTFAIIGLLLVGWLIAKLAEDAQKPLPLAAIELGGDGGDGLPPGGNPGAAGASTAPKEAAPSESNTETKPPEEPKIPTEVPKITAPEPTKTPEPNNDKVIEDSIVTLNQANQESLQQLTQSLARPPAKAGNGEPGTGSGNAKGDGPGSGAAGVPGQIRSSRQQRWQLHFTTDSVGDHLRQLDALGAIIALPMPKGGFKVFYDLKKRPLVGKVEDINKFQTKNNRLYWVDRNPETATEIARVANMPPAPLFVAFFPLELENKMAEMEKAIRGNVDESKFSGTMRFEAKRKGGTWVVMPAAGE